MEQIQLKATRREEKGSRQVKKIRNQGLVPGIVYHRGEDPVSVVVLAKEISKIIHDAGGENLLIKLNLEKEKKKSRVVIIKEVQHDPTTRNILHVDFNEVSLSEKITVEVEVFPKGESVGVKQDGGVLDQPLRTLKIQCLPIDIPPHIDVDISNLALNGSIHVKNLAISEKIKVLNDPEAMLFQVKLPVEEKPEETVETPELEVIREKKEEEPKAAEKAPAKEEPKAKEALKPEKK